MLLFLGAGTLVFSRSEWASLSATITQLTWLSVAGAIMLMLAGSMLGALRLKLVASDLGYRLTYRDAVSALSLGQLGGILFFQLAGQLMARGALLSRRDIPMSGTIVVTGYERLAALSVSLSLAIAAAVYLYGGISIDTAAGGLDVIKLFLGLAIVVASGAAFCWGHLVVDNIPRLSTRTLFNFGRSVVLSVAIQAMTMAAYVLLLKSLAPQAEVLDLAAASALVMFAASLPISFAGWGIREMSAVIALGTVGIAANISFPVAAMVGLSSLVAVGLMAVAAVEHRPRVTALHRPSVAQQIDFAAALDYALPLCAATAVFFQVFVPVERGVLNVNLADPSVFLGGSLFLLTCLAAGRPRWRIAHLELYVGLATLMIVTAFLHGIGTFGWTSWAFTNRLLGWFVLLAYGATGALIVRRAGHDGLDLLLRTFVVVATSIVGLELALLAIHGFNGRALDSLIELPLVGFSVNRNAFAFQLLLAVCAALATRWRRPSLPLGIIFSGLWFCGSRSVFIALPIVMMVAGYLGHLTLRRTFASLLFATGIVGFITFGPKFVAYWLPLQTLASSPHGVPLELVSSDGEHLKSMLGGWAMFTAHPIFGAGLGAYMHQQIEAGAALVIHSTPLWLLAEMGLVGFLVMAVPIIRIFSREVRAPHPNDMAGITLVLIIMAFAVVSNVHDMMYQRAFWLLLGAALAYAPEAQLETGIRLIDNKRKVIQAIVSS